MPGRRFQSGSGGVGHGLSAAGAGAPADAVGGKVESGQPFAIPRSRRLPRPGERPGWPGADAAGARGRRWGARGGRASFSSVPNSPAFSLLPSQLALERLVGDRVAATGGLRRRRGGGGRSQPGGSGDAMWRGRLLGIALGVAVLWASQAGAAAAGHAGGVSAKESRASRAKRRGQGGGGHDALKG